MSPCARMFPGGCSAPPPGKIRIDRVFPLTTATPRPGEDNDQHTPHPESDRAEFPTRHKPLLHAQELRILAARRQTSPAAATKNVS